MKKKKKKEEVASMHNVVHKPGANHAFVPLKHCQSENGISLFQPRRKRDIITRRAQMNAHTLKATPLKKPFKHDDDDL